VRVCSFGGRENLRSRTFTIVFTLVFLTIVAGGSFGLILNYYESYVNFSNPYSYVPTKPASSLIATPNATADHAIIFVLDGVRADIFHETSKPFIDSQTWANWTDVQVNTLTSVSKVGYSTIASGVNSSESQVISNDYPDSQLFLGDSLFNDTIRHNGNTSVVGYYWWWEFFKPWLNWSVTYDSTSIGMPTTSMNSTNGGPLVNKTYPVYLDSLVAQDAITIVQKNKPTFMVVHFSLTDEYAHAGGSLSPNYINAIKNEDTYIGQILGAYNAAGILQSTLVVVTADHGHVDVGGHGGTEPSVLHIPLIMRGPGVITGLYSTPVHQNSIAPTVAALMGWEVPSDASGTILFQCLKLNLKQQAIYSINLAQIRLSQANITLQKMGYYATWKSTLTPSSAHLSEAKGNFTAAEYASAIMNALSSLNASNTNLGSSWSSKASEQIAGRALLAIAIIAVVALLLAFLFLRYRRKIDSAMGEERDFLGVTVLSFAMYFIILAFVTYLVQWHSSASYFPNSETLFLIDVFVPTLVALIPTLILFLWLMRAVSIDANSSEARGVTYTALLFILIAIGYLSMIVYFLIINGLALPWYAHDLNGPIEYLYIGISSTAFAIYALITFLVGLGVAKVFRVGGVAKK
jgi:hypothetical protein